MRATDEQIAAVANAAAELCENWNEGGFARAMCRDSLVRVMVEAGLIPPLPTSQDEVIARNAKLDRVVEKYTEWLEQDDETIGELEAAVAAGQARVMRALALELVESIRGDS